MKARRITALVAAASAVTLAVSACSSSKSGGGSSGNGPVTIGLSVSLTGVNSAVGTEFLKGVKIWADMINNGTGLYQGKKGLLGRTVKLEYSDDQSVPENALTTYTRYMTHDKVDFVLPPYGSGPSGTVAPLAQKYGYAMIMTAAADPGIFAKGNPLIVQAAAPIQSWPSDTPGLVKSAGYSTVSILNVNSSSGLAMQKSLTDGFGSNGIKVLSDQVFEAGTKDYTPDLLKAKADSPDAIVVNGFGPDAVTIMNQAQQLKIHPKMWVFIGGAYRNDVFIGGVGAASNCVIGDAQWSPSLPYPGVKDLATALGDASLAKSGADGSASWGFSAGELLTDAVNKLGDAAFKTPQKAIINYLRNTSGLQTMVGPLKVDPATGQSLMPGPVLNQIEDGKRTIVWPPDKATAKAVLPCPGS